LEARLADLLRIVTRVAARDFSEKPVALEGDDALARFTVGFRFMIEDLERTLAALERERADLQVANERLKELDRIKTRLINSAAHELGTPLTPIKMQLFMLRSMTDPLTPRQKRGIEILDRNVERLSFLVRDMLDVARLESGRMEIKNDPIDLSDLVREVSETFVDLAARANVTMESRSEAGLWVRGDANRLTQVLYNFLSNALKFSRPGGRITIAAQRMGSQVVLGVKDTGLGLDEGQISRLFQPFTQVHDPMIVTVAGTGLGLYISRGIIAAHDGRIWAESPGVGQGSTFAFALAGVAAPAPLVAPARASASLHG
jgi:two-component system, sensor histidine kinase